MRLGGIVSMPLSFFISTLFLRSLISVSLTILKKKTVTFGTQTEAIARRSSNMELDSWQY